jgi:holo-[acyl-carrier protein] synthase|tara:strand:- start:477 stop:833 length:357 start_codon:yes stop_codon:yes gene_type:complete
MIEQFGIGIDIVNIERFQKTSYDLKPSFYKKLFRKNEIAYCLKFKNSSEHFAGKFALKESVKKSINENISFLEIGISYKNSKPHITIFGKQKNQYDFQASVSHDAGTAIAIVMSEKLS